MKPASITLIFLLISSLNIGGTRALLYAESQIASRQVPGEQLGLTGWISEAPDGFTLKDKRSNGKTGGVIEWNRTVTLIIKGQKKMETLAIHAIYGDGVHFVNSITNLEPTRLVGNVSESRRNGRPFYHYRYLGAHLGGSDQDSYVLAYEGTKPFSRTIVLTYTYKSEEAGKLGLSSFERMAKTLHPVFDEDSKEGSIPKASEKVPLLR
jgi:hypothetical protein